MTTQTVFILMALPYALLAAFAVVLIFRQRRSARKMAMAWETRRGLYSTRATNDEAYELEHIAAAIAILDARDRERERIEGANS